MGRKQLTTSLSSAALHKREWMMEENGRALSDSSVVFRQRLDKMMDDMDGGHGEELTKEQVRQIFQTAIGRIDELLFDKIFALFDVCNNGSVRKDDFLVAMAFLLKRGSARDTIDLAFRLFDVDANGRMTHKEFNTMIAAIMSNRLKFALQTDAGRQAFKKHMEQEWSSESVEFWEKVTEICDKYEAPHELIAAADSSGLASAESAEGVGIPISVAEGLFLQFISSGAPDQINIASQTREGVAEDISRANARGEATVPVRSFKLAAEEIMQLMELDNFERFRQNVAEEADRALEGEAHRIDFATEAWASLGLGETDSMSRDDFRTWAGRAQNKPYFAFLDEMSQAFHTLFAEPMEDANAEKNCGAEELGARSTSPEPSEAHATADHRQPHDRADDFVADTSPVPASAPVPSLLIDPDLFPGAVSMAPDDVESLSTSPSKLSRAMSAPKRTKMPKRMYSRSKGSIVSVSTQTDSSGRQLRVISIASNLDEAQNRVIPLTPPSPESPASPGSPLPGSLVIGTNWSIPGSPSEGPSPVALGAPPASS